MTPSVLGTVEDIANALREQKKDNKKKCLTALKALLIALEETQTCYQETVKLGEADAVLEKMISHYWEATAIAFNNIPKVNNAAVQLFSKPKSRLLNSKNWLDDLNRNYQWNFDPTIKTVRNVRDYIRK